MSTCDLTDSRLTQKMKIQTLSFALASTLPLCTTPLLTTYVALQSVFVVRGDDLFFFWIDHLLMQRWP